MDKPSRPKSTPSENVADRPQYAELTPDEERAFLQEQAMYEAARRQTGDLLALWEALSHVWHSRQTVPDWLRMALLAVVTRGTPNEVRRERERWQLARRYTCVRNHRQTVDERTGKKCTKDRALDLAVIDLQAEGDAVARKTIENDYDKIRKDLKRRGRQSAWSYFVDNEGEY
jgi:hypothetical protein